MTQLHILQLPMAIVAAANAVKSCLADLNAMTLLAFLRSLVKFRNYFGQVATVFGCRTECSRVKFRPMSMTMTIVEIS